MRCKEKQEKHNKHTYFEKSLSTSSSKLRYDSFWAIGRFFSSSFEIKNSATEKYQVTHCSVCVKHCAFNASIFFFRYKNFFSCQHPLCISCAASIVHGKISAPRVIDAIRNSWKKISKNIFSFRIRSIEDFCKATQISLADLKASWKISHSVIENELIYGFRFIFSS
jgi:hypothetical protein